MTKQRISHKEIIREVAMTLGNDDVKLVIETYLEAVVRHMLREENVAIKNIGVLKIVDVSSKTAWSFAEKKNVVYPERKLPKMIFSRHLVSKIKSKI